MGTSQKPMKTYYCWRCEVDMPFLDEAEWQLIAPLLANVIAEIKEYRRAHCCDLATARKHVMQEAMQMFETLTGVPNVHFETIYHHRLGGWGSECPECGHLLRTPEASYCAHCGERRSST